jgi:lysophospholipase L1-like esterase
MFCSPFLLRSIINFKMLRAAFLSGLPLRRSLALCGLIACGMNLAAIEARAEVTVATVGDSLADAVYLGLKLQPDLLRKSGIRLVRWSRPKIGLTRTDYFDYTAWLRDNADLGRVDFCVVQLGANDLQSIATADNKWIRVGTEAWQRAYTDRVQALVQTLKPQRCAKVVWLLQPAYQNNKYLSQYHEMINAVQFAGSSGGAAAFEIDAGAGDYSADGVHFNKDFCFKMARAVANLFAAWPHPFAGSNCASCHAAPGLPDRLPDLAPLIPRPARQSAP